MPVKDRFVDFCIEQFSALGDISSRYMFGGWCLYCDGVVFALIAGGSVYLKADDHSIPRFSAAQLQPFRPFEDQNVVIKYYQAPPEIFENSDALRDWGGEAVAAGARARQSKSRKTKSKQQ